MLTSCLECGEPSEGTRCDEHAIKRQPRAWTARDTGRWRRLSRRLRKMQPFCLQCGTPDDLTVDHIVPLDAGGDPFDVSNLQVICRRHNSMKGTTWGETPPPVPPRAAGEAKFASHMRITRNNGVE